MCLIHIALSSFSAISCRVVSCHLVSVRVMLLCCFWFFDLITFSAKSIRFHFFCSPCLVGSESQTRESVRNELVAEDGQDLGNQLFDGEGMVWYSMVWYGMVQNSTRQESAPEL